MNPEQLLLGGLSAVTTALCFVAKLLWKEAQDCKRDRIALRKEVEDLRATSGRAQGRLEQYAPVICLGLRYSQARSMPCAAISLAIPLRA